MSNKTTRDNKDFVFFSKNEDGSNSAEKSDVRKLSPSPKKKKAKVANIIKGVKIIVEVEGNGQAIVYNEKEHSAVSVGDTIEI